MISGFELIDEFNLVEVKENINELSILYKNEDILKSKKEIKVIRITVSNNGDTILQSYYDQLEPFGIRFFKSKILNAEVVSTNSKDLGSKLINRYSQGVTPNHDDLIFSKVIFDENDFVTIKITLLQASEEKLDISVLGKLANIKDLKINRVDNKPVAPTSPWIYIVGGYFGFIGVMIILIYLIEHLKSRAKKKKINKYIRKHGDFGEAESKIVEVYSELDGRTEKLISDFLKGNAVLDFKEIMELDRPLSSPLRQIFSPLPHTRRFQFHSLPREIFCVEGASVTLNLENEVFIRSFFGEVL